MAVLVVGRTSSDIIKQAAELDVRPPALPLQHTAFSFSFETASILVKCETEEHEWTYAEDGVAVVFGCKLFQNFVGKRRTVARIYRK